jgi:hypothetical protein
MGKFGAEGKNFDKENFLWVFPGAGRSLLSFMTKFQSDFAVFARSAKGQAAPQLLLCYWHRICIAHEFV